MTAKTKRNRMYYLRKKAKLFFRVYKKQLGVNVSKIDALTPYEKKLIAALRDEYGYVIQSEI